MESSNTLAQYNRGISDGEKTFLSNRLPIVKAALETILNRSLNNKRIPKIALIGSGGGYRAMLCTTGSLNGAQKIGLLDATTYITALSGSTWAVAPWISTGIAIKQFKNYIQDCAAKPFTQLNSDEKNLLLKDLLVKIKNNQKITLVDPYGGLLANRLLEFLGDQRQATTLSDQAQKIKLGFYPYAIYTAIDGRENIATGQTWYEFTPHTIGDRTNNIHIPTWTYGKKFKEGQPTNNAPEKSLAYCMGTWGSAFAANIYEILKEVIHYNVILEEITEILPDSIEGERILPFYAEVRNYMYQMRNLNDTSLSENKHLMFVDAGLEINLPYSPVSGICPERTADILIFLDASAGDNIGNQLQKVADYAKKFNCPFPAINLENIGKKTISVFKDENNTSTPVVIYMPRISDQALWQDNKLKPEFAKYNLSGFDLDHETNNGYCKTEEFQYTPEHSALVMNQTEFNMRVNKYTIIKEINEWIDRK